MNIIIETDNTLFVPEIKTLQSSGADIKADLNKECIHIFGESVYTKGTSIIIYPNSRVSINCGFKMQIPKGYRASIRPRSGNSTYDGYHIPNTPGTIDSDYRGDVMLSIHNLHPVKPIEIKHGERIAQMLIEKDIKVNYVIGVVDTNTERGVGGFGHTGKH